MRKVSLQTHTLDVPPQDVITRDNVSVHVNAVLFFQVIEPVAAVIKVEDYLYATSQMAQTTLRSVLGQQELDDLLSEREKLNLQLQKLIDHATEPWGVKVSAVEIKKVDLPQEMQRAMAKQAEAERERRAKVIAAEGEYQAAEKLVMAAVKMSANPVAIQMRYLQSLTEIGNQANNTIVFPFPLEFMNAFVKPGSKVTVVSEPEVAPEAGDSQQGPA
jgi:regulator of protease activity HflC (stomatin/prohibitin superfamily)